MSDIAGIEQALHDLRTASQLSGAYKVIESASPVIYEHMGVVGSGALITTKKGPDFVSVAGLYETPDATYVTHMEKNALGSYANATIYHHTDKEAVAPLNETKNPATVKKLTALIAEQVLLQLPIPNSKPQ